MKITMNEMAYIAKWYENISPISLLANMETKEDGTELFSLMEKQIVQEDELGPEYRPLFDILANTRQSTKLYIKDRFSEIQKYTCRSEQGLVLVANWEDELEITLPMAFNEVTDEITNLIGNSSLKSANIEGVYTQGELLVLMAFIDLYRTLGLKSYIGEELEVRGLTAYEVYNALKNESGNRLTHLLITHCNLPTPEMGELSQWIDQLILKGCLVKGTDLLESDASATYELTESYALFSSGFLVPEIIITLEEMGYNRQGELTSASSLCVGAGYRDLLFITFGENDAEMATISSEQLLRLIQNLLSCPEL